MLLRTNLPETVRQVASEEAVSVIHAPESFKTWVSSQLVDSVPNNGVGVLTQNQKGNERAQSGQSAERPPDVISPPPSEPSTKVSKRAYYSH